MNLTFHVLHYIIRATTGGSVSIGVPFTLGPVLSPVVRAQGVVRPGAGHGQGLARLRCDGQGSVAGDVTYS